MNRVLMIVAAATLAACAPQAFEGEGMQGRLPTVGRFADSTPMLEVERFSESTSLRADHLGNAWAMTRVQFSDNDLARAQDGAVSINPVSAVGCSGPQMNDWEYDEAPQEVEMQIVQDVDGVDLIEIDQDFGMAGYVITRLPVDTF